jgi:hypothetical protein
MFTHPASTAPATSQQPDPAAQRRTSTSTMVCRLLAIPAAACAIAACSALAPLGVSAASAATAKSAPTTIAQAQARWPGAQLAAPGTRLHPGRYIIKDAIGHYDLLSISVSVSAPSGERPHGSQQPATASYCTGCTYDVTVNASLSSVVTGTQTFHTYNGVDYGYRAWAISYTASCTNGLGTCGTAQTGVIGQNSAEVNPWDNQPWTYSGVADIAYLRVYVTDTLGVSAWGKWS